MECSLPRWLALPTSSLLAAPQGLSCSPDTCRALHPLLTSGLPRLPPKTVVPSEATSFLNSDQSSEIKGSGRAAARHVPSSVPSDIKSTRALMCPSGLPRAGREVGHHSSPDRAPRLRREARAQRVWGHTLRDAVGTALGVLLARALPPSLTFL